MLMGVIITIALALLNGAGIQPTSLVLLLLNPTGWENSSFWLVFSSLLTVTGFIVIGLAAIIKQDWVLRAGIVATLSSIVIAPFVDLFRFLNSHMGYIANASCINAPVCSQLNSIGGIGQFVSIAIAGPLLLYAMWASIEWVFKGDSF